MPATVLWYQGAVAEAKNPVPGALAGVLSFCTETCHFRIWTQNQVEVTKLIIKCNLKSEPASNWPIVLKRFHGAPGSKPAPLGQFHSL